MRANKFENIIISEYIKGTPIKEMVKTLGVQMTYVRTIIDKIKSNTAKEKSNEFTDKRLQLIFIEKELFSAIKLEQKNPTFENVKRVNELSSIYCKFLLV
jgi:predicted transcriptional regulator